MKAPSADKEELIFSQDIKVTQVFVILSVCLNTKIFMILTAYVTLLVNLIYSCNN